MNDSLFNKIIKGELPCHKIYENDQILAFLDIHPKTPGHTLVVPKKQVEFIWDLDEATYKELMEVVRKVGIRIREVMGFPYVGQMVVGLDVPHTHVHVFPFSNMAEYSQSQDMNQEPDQNVLSSVAKKIAF